MLEFELESFMRWFLWTACPHTGTKSRMRCSGENFEKAAYNDLVTHVTEAFRTRDAELYGLRVQVAALRNKITGLERKK